MLDILKTLITFTLILSLSACSFFIPSSQSIRINTDQHDAKIYVNGEFAGEGSVQTSARRNENVSVLVKKDGYKSQQREIQTAFGMGAALDVIGGLIFLIPFIGLAAPGAWSLNQTNISIIMDKI